LNLKNGANLSAPHIVHSVLKLFEKPNDLPKYKSSHITKAMSAPLTYHGQG
jgi:hypothetical protein